MRLFYFFVNQLDYEVFGLGRTLSGVGRTVRDSTLAIFKTPNRRSVCQKMRGDTVVHT